MRDIDIDPDILVIIAVACFFALVACIVLVFQDRGRK